MSTDPIPFDQEPFGFLSRNPSIRTFSHKASNQNRAKLLPQLKPSPATKRKWYDSPEPEPVRESSQGDRPPEAAEKDQATEADGTYPYEVEYGDDVADDSEGVQEDERNSASLHSNLRKPPLEREFTDEDDGHDRHDDEDGEHDGLHDPQTFITDFPDDSVRHNSSAPTIPSSSVRRKPFLIFAKTPSKPTSYKKLERKNPDSAKSTKVNYIPGDGFSDNEARPNGLFNHKRRKLHYSSPAVGSLDLTQTPPRLPRPTTATTTTASSQPKEPRIILKRKKRKIDNSFLPRTPKKPRAKRPREKEDGEVSRKETGAPSTRDEFSPRTPTPVLGISAPHGQAVSNVILSEPGNNDQQPQSPPRVTKEDTANEVMKDAGIPGDNIEEISAPVSDPEHGLANDQAEDDNQVDRGREQDDAIVPYSEDQYVAATQYRSKSSPPVKTVQQEGEELSPSLRPFRRAKSN
ncbi:hypothetical protein V8F06_007573 [Rhypophila decipiens]